MESLSEGAGACWEQAPSTGDGSWHLSRHSVQVRTLAASSDLSSLPGRLEDWLVVVIIPACSLHLGWWSCILFVRCGCAVCACVILDNIKAALHRLLRARQTESQRQLFWLLHTMLCRGWHYPSLVPCELEESADQACAIESGMPLWSNAPLIVT